MSTRREYTQEFKERAVELVKSSGRRPKHIAEELGISVENVRRWLREKEQGEKGNIIVFPGRGNPRDEKLHQLEKENAELREANAILKKAMAIFAEKRPR